MNAAKIELELWHTKIVLKNHWYIVYLQECTNVMRYYVCTVYVKCHNSAFFVELLIKNTFGPFTLAYILYFLNWIWLVLHKDAKYQKHLNHKKLHLFWHFSKMIVFYDHVGAKFKWNTQKFIHFHFRKFLNGNILYPISI